MRLVAHQRIHQSTFAGALWPSDCDGLVVDSRSVNMSSGYELPDTVLIEFAIPRNHLDQLLFP